MRMRQHMYTNKHTQMYPEKNGSHNYIYYAILLCYTTLRTFGASANSNVLGSRQVVGSHDRWRQAREHARTRVSTLTHMHTHTHTAPTYPYTYTNTHFAAVHATSMARANARLRTSSSRRLLCTAHCGPAAASCCSVVCVRRREVFVVVVVVVGFFPHVVAVVAAAHSLSTVVRLYCAHARARADDDDHAA